MDFLSSQHHRERMAMTSPLSLDSSSGSSRGDQESPKSRSSSFSISAILSDDIGSQKKSNLSWRTTPTSEAGKDRMLSHTPKRPKEAELQRMSTVKRLPQISLTEAAGLIAPGSSSTLQVHPSHPIASIGTTPPMHHRQHNSSLTASPFDPSFLHALGQQTSPTEKEDLLSDSLGMLSTVAMYHSELSSSLGTPIQNKMADIRITSSHDGSDKSSDWNGGDPVINTSKALEKSRRTPSILKRRTRKPCGSVGSDSGISGDETVSRDRTNLNAGFLSPLASEKSALNSQQSGFSPSIFLSRPDHSVMSDDQSEVVKGRQSPFSDSDSNHDEDFTTSTPIKLDKENVVVRRRRPGWSPNILRRRQITTESSSESEHPVKRSLSSPHSPPTKRHKKSKARTKLSPLLENACSPISKTDHIPSPLTHSTTPTHPPQSQASLVTQSTHSSMSMEVPKTFQIPMSTQHTSLPVATTSNSFFNPYLLNLSQPQPTCIIPQLFQNTGQNLTYPVNHLMPTVTSLQQHSYSTPILSPPHQYQRPLLSPPMGLPPTSNPYLRMPFYLPQSSGYGRNGFVQMQMMPPNFSYGGIGNTFNASGNSFVSNMSLSSLSANQSASNSSFLRRDDKLKSVPPRFIFPSMRPEGKRSRLTEAINKSLSETPSESTRLPKEWTKYACGQTNDQKDMTDKARSFILQCRPRTLNFEEDANN